MPPPTQHPSAWKVTGITFGAVVAGILVFLVVRGSSLPPDDVHPGPYLVLMFLDVVLGLTAIGLLPLALRRAPVGVGLAVIALSGLSTLAFPAACLCIVRIAALRCRRALIATVLVFAAAVGADLILNPVNDAGDGDIWWVAPIALGFLLVLILIGLNRGARRALIVSLRQEADSARREQDARVDQARLAERTRIAREMHDTLAHRLSLISLHAGALEYRTDLDPETIRSTAGILRETAHKAASELRTVLTVLREEAADTAPQPTISSIPALVESARAAGTDITLSIEPALLSTDGDSPGDATSRHLYRVVQECLTNAQKHAPGRPVTVSLTGAPGQGITVTVSNPVSGSKPPAPDGLGLIGLAERARLSGGSFESGHRRGLYITKVQVPW